MATDKQPTSCSAYDAEATAAVDQQSHLKSQTKLSNRQHIEVEQGQNLPGTRGESSEDDAINSRLPQVYSGCRTVLSKEFAMFVGVQKISEMCDRLQLQVSCQQHSTEIIISGTLPFLNMFRQDALQVWAAFSHDHACSVAFGSGCEPRHSPAQASAEKLEGQEKLAGELGFDTTKQSSRHRPSDEEHHEGAGVLDNHMSSVDIFLKTKTQLGQGVVLFFGILKIDDLCTQFHLQLVADQKRSSVCVVGIYSDVTAFGLHINQLLRDCSSSSAYVRMFGENLPAIPSSYLAASPSPLLDSKATACASSTSDGDVVHKETAKNVATGESSDSTPKRSDPMQLNKSTYDIVEITAREKLESIQKECHVKIRKESVPGSANTEVLLVVESNSSNCDIQHAAELLKQECLMVSGALKREVKIPLKRGANVVALKQTKWEEMRVKATFTNDQCTVYGLEEDVRAAEKQIGHLLRRTPLSEATEGFEANFTLQGGQTIIVKKGNIVNEDVDVIVNAANSNLQHDGGVAAAICKAAGGTSFREECARLVRKRGRVTEGDAVCSRAGLLPYKAIVHAVAPRWSHWSTEHKRIISLLEKACYNSLHLADKSNGTSVAIPGLGSGVFGVPKDVCAQALFVGTERFFQTNRSSVIRRVVFIDLDDSSVAEFTKEARKRYGDTSASYTTQANRDAKGSDGTFAQFFQTLKSFVPFLDSKDTSKPTTDKDKSAEHEQCPICYDRDVNMSLPCSHRFCQQCIDQWAKQKKLTCPTCSRPFGKVEGNQPKGGNMTTTIFKTTSLPGYERCGTIELRYNIPSGWQGSEHPNPGQRHHGTTRIGYLPNNQEGQELLSLLRKAFEARLVFTVGRSITTGVDNVVTWNDIHHKTNMYGGPQNYGYPDPTYLQRLREDLRAKGIQ